MRASASRNKRISGSRGQALFAGLLLAVILSFAFAGGALAQDAPPRVEASAGVVPDAGSFVVEFIGAVGDVVTITARAVEGNFDPLMTVRTADGAFVAGNDNAFTPDPGLNPSDARVEQLRLAADGAYVVEVSGLNAKGGAVEVTTVWEVDRGAATGRENALQARFAVPLTSERNIVTVGAWDRYIFPFDAQRGDVYTFTARANSGDIDPRLALYYEDTLLIDANEDHGSSDPTMGVGDSRLLNVILPRAGRYFVEVRGYEATTGEVAFGVDLVTREALVYPGTDLPFEGTLAEGEQHDIALEAQVGDFVTLTVQAGTPLLDPMVRLLSPGGEPLIDNDNHGYNDADIDFFDARIKNYLIPASGTYTVRVGSARGGAGPYTAIVNIKRNPRLFD